MKILSVESLAIPEVKVIRFERFQDHRGYFVEHFRRGDFRSHSQTAFMNGIEFVQGNESYSRAGAIRGLHFQWNPYMGKLVRTLFGHMVDLAMDIRKGSPTFGRLIAHDMPTHPGDESSQWIWLPPGFAHGNYFLEDTTIEYFCSGEYNPECEAGISPMSPDIDWSLCDPLLKARFLEITSKKPLISEKDANALSVNGWKQDARSDHFIYRKTV